MDLSALSTKQLSEEGVEMDVCDPRTGDPVVDSESGEKITITLSGVDGKRYREQQRKMQSRRLKNVGRGPKAKVDFDVDSFEAESLDLLASCTLGWKHITWKGQALPFSTENARMLYTELSWLREQVDAFVGDRQNFFQRPANNSSSTTEQ